MQKYFSGKVILVTGAAGFIGSHLCDHLLSFGATVIGVDNLISGNLHNIEHLLKNTAADPEVEEKNARFFFIEADVSKPVEEYLDVNTKVDLILHFASPASPPFYQKHPVATYLVNSMGTHHLLQFLKDYNPKSRFLYASTSEIYGDPLVHPQTEDYWGNVNPNGVRACYDEGKRLGETIVGVFERDFEIDARIVRIFNTYGPRIDLEDGRVIPNFIKEALEGKPYTIYGDGSQTRSYCYIDDLVQGILSLAALKDGKGQTVNLGNPGEYTILETALELHKIMTENKNVTVKDIPRTSHPLPKDDPTRRKPDISKAKRLLGWEPKVSFVDGLKITYSYFKNLNSTE